MAPYTKWQKEIAERSNRMIKEMARAMLIAFNTPVVFWHRAVAVAVYLLNRLPTTSLPEGQTPYGVLYKRHLSVEAAHPFGCDMHVVVLQNRRTAFEDT